MADFPINWCFGLELNQRPSVLQTDTLPTELPKHNWGEAGNRTLVFRFTAGYSTTELESPLSGIRSQSRTDGFTGLQSVALDHSAIRTLFGVPQRFNSAYHHIGLLSFDRANALEH